jgi:nucleotide-binding universal stress UspA family protein
METDSAPLARSIVAAVDFGEASAHAVRVAGALAARLGSSLRLVHGETVEAPPYFTSEQVEALEAQRRQTRAQAERYLTAFGRRETQAPFEAVVSPHPPVDAILREAAGTDLIVMGTHGRRGPAHWWLGSVAERVLREADRPLLIVRAGADRGERLADRIEVHARAERGGAVAWAAALAAAAHGAVVHRATDDDDGPAGAGPGATLVVIGVPEPRTPRWLSKHAEPWIRGSTVPLVFVPERS